MEFSDQDHSSARRSLKCSVKELESAVKSGFDVNEIRRRLFVVASEGNERSILLIDFFRDMLVKQQSRGPAFFKALLSFGLDTSPIQVALKDGTSYPVDFHDMVFLGLRLVPSNQIQSGDIVRSRDAAEKMFGTALELHRILISSGVRFSQSSITRYLDFFRGIGCTSIFGAGSPAHEKAREILSPFIERLCFMFLEDNGTTARFKSGATLLHYTATLSDDVFSADSFGRLLRSGIDLSFVDEFGQSAASNAYSNRNGEKKREEFEKMGYSLTSRDSSGIPMMAYDFSRKCYTYYQSAKEILDDFAAYRNVDADMFSEILNTQLPMDDGTLFIKCFEKMSHHDGFMQVAMWLALSCDADIAASDSHGLTCFDHIDIALRKDFNATIDFIIEGVKAGVDFSRGKEYGRFPLYHSLAGMFDGDAEQLGIFMKRMSENGVSPSLDTSPAAVLDCLKCNKTALLQVLLENGADAKAHLENGKTLVKEAFEPFAFSFLPSYAGCINSARLRGAVYLCEYGADVNEIVDEAMNDTPLFLIAGLWEKYKGQITIDIPKRLLELGASTIDMANGRTILGAVSHLHKMRRASLKGCSSFLSVVIPALLREIDRHPDRWNVIEILSKECAELAQSGAVKKSYEPVIAKIVKVIGSYDRVADAVVSVSDYEDLLMESVETPEPER